MSHKDRHKSQHKKSISDRDPVHIIERVMKIDTSHNMRSPDPDRNPVHSIE